MGPQRMDSKLRSPALKMAGWGLLHGDFFDLYDVVEVLEIPSGQAGDLMIYLRSMKCVELVAEVRRGLKEEKKVHKRIFIKVYSPRAGSQVEEGAISFKIRAGLPSVDQIA